MNFEGEVAMNKDYIKRCLIIVLSIMIIFSSIISNCHAHFLECHEDHCAICAMILIANQLVLISFIVITLLLSLMLISYFLSRMHKKNNIFSAKSLIIQKVQFNE